VPGLVVIRSLTKLWGLAGLRVGYLLASPEVVAALQERRQPWSVNSVALAALVACSVDAITPAAKGRAVARARHDLVARLADLPGVRAWPASANFLLLRVGGGEGVVRRLASRGIAVRPAHTFPGLTADHIRVAVRQPKDHARLVAALRAASSR
jgi:histidinol-phosphate aminotransferase